MYAANVVQASRTFLHLAVSMAGDAEEDEPLQDYYEEHEAEETANEDFMKYEESEEDTSNINRGGEGKGKQRGRPLGLRSKQNNQHSRQRAPKFKSSTVLARDSLELSAARSYARAATRGSISASFHQALGSAGRIARPCRTSRTPPEHRGKKHGLHRSALILPSCSKSLKCTMPVALNERMAARGLP